MPGFGSIAGIPAAWLSAATVVSALWIGDRLISPIAALEESRREIRASLVVAFSLRDTVARRARKDDIEALNALSDARRDLKAQAKQLAGLQAILLSQFASMPVSGVTILSRPSMGCGDFQILLLHRTDAGLSMERRSLWDSG